MSVNDQISVGGLDFSWKLDKGLFNFEGQDAVLFWISSAMKAFFDTIEEISGEEASRLVLETTGYRQGMVVGDYFEKMKHVSVQEAATLITTTYASAGWGNIVIENLDREAHTLTVYLKDSWEHKINVAQEKTTGGSFLPGHFAGIFSGLFATNVWYEVEYFQLEGHEDTKINYFPSDITITENIHNLSRKKELDHIVQLEAEVENKTRELKDLVKQLSSPIIPVLNGIVVVPLIGKYDEERSEELVTKTLENLPAYQASYLILDLTGLDQDSGELTTHLIGRLGTAASLIGTETVLVGISPKLSQVISKQPIQFREFNCFQTLQHGIYYALAQQGRRIV
ncbi:STAS domain-containing protein [Radiobacillus deserti]|uniref:STAS domain-containing protein n=1 Tax=Radiobacillus deserti TaxID=2594883 RepID=A0A516KEU0_9BACI|nr:STAS domain-containing protein [Radiobacillus deserti]QDP39928.1 STAS domain-containing protein [Radiobacillus deserti]